MHPRAGRGGRSLPLALLLLPLALTGCGVGGAVQSLFQPAARGAVDAHVVYRLWPDCPTLVARTTEHGYTVLTPLDTVAVEQDDDFVGLVYEETGLFEGPVREGRSVFRYWPPVESETWGAGGAAVPVDVVATRLDLPGAHAAAVARCGPLPAEVPGDDVPRVPRQ